MEVKCEWCMYWEACFVDGGYGACHYEVDIVLKAASDWCRHFFPNDPGLCYCESCMFGAEGHCRLDAMFKSAGIRYFCGKFKAVKTK